MDNELCEAAIAYYNNGSSEEQNVAKQFFRAMDVDGSGRVSLKEYTDFLSGTAGLACFDHEFFRGLDRNGDGYVDFFEFLTLYYVCQRQTVACDTCSKLLNGLHFTCVECFETPSVDTFDLCVKCYKDKTYKHQHGAFLDSYVLLRAKRNPQPPEKPQSPSPQLRNDDDDDDFSLSEAYTALEVGFTVGSVALGACTIM